MGRGSRKSQGEAALLVLLLIGCLVLAVGALLPAIVVVAWIVAELTVGVTRRAGDADAAAERPEEIVAAIEQQERVDRAERRLGTLYGRSSGHSRRSDGRLDERYRGARNLNYEIDAARSEARSAQMAVDELREKPLRRWTTWARPFRYLWALRLGATAAAILTYISVLEGWWNPATFLSIWSVSGMPDVTMSMVGTVVGIATTIIIVWKIGWSFGVRMAAQHLQTDQSARSLAGRPTARRLIGIAGMAAPLIAVTLAVGTMSSTLEAIPVAASAAISTPQTPPVEVPAAASIDVRPHPKRKRRRKTAVSVEKSQATGDPSASTESTERPFPGGSEADLQTEKEAPGDM